MYACIHIVSRYCRAKHVGHIVPHTEPYHFPFLRRLGPEVGTIFKMAFTDTNLYV